MRTAFANVPKQTLLRLASTQKLEPAGSHCKREAAKDLPYCEDLVIWESLRVAIVSSDPERDGFNPFTGEGDASLVQPGRISVFHLDGASDVYHLDILEWPENRALHPLGLGLLETSSKSEALLAFCNYEQRSASVELLRLTVDQSTLSAAGKPLLRASYVCSFEHAELTAPNAVVLLSEQQILVTNSYGFSPRGQKLLFQMEQILALPRGSVMLLTRSATADKQYSTTAQHVCTGIALANGLALSADHSGRRLLAISGCTSHQVQLYDVWLGSDRLLHDPRAQIKYRKTIPVGYLPDNLHFVPQALTQQTASETLLVAGHPSALSFLRTAANKGKIPPLAPSRVITVSIPIARTSSSAVLNELSKLFVYRGKGVQTLFECPGSQYGTSSTAVAYVGEHGDTELLICGLWDQGLLRCSGAFLESGGRKT